VVCGGGQAKVEGCEGGFFVQPTVLADMNNQMKAAREEIFGPVLAVIKFATQEQAITHALEGIASPTATPMPLCCQS